MTVSLAIFFRKLGSASTKDLGNLRKIIILNPVHQRRYFLFIFKYWKKRHTFFIEFLIDQTVSLQFSKNSVRWRKILING
jgi:hypothetical protein